MRDPDARLHRQCLLDFAIVAIAPAQRLDLRIAKAGTMAQIG